jgi:hypothetical protein
MSKCILPQKEPLLRWLNLWALDGPREARNVLFRGQRDLSLKSEILDHEELNICIENERSSIKYSTPAKGTK